MTTDLITRLEQAAAPCRELDAEIADLIKWWPQDFTRIDYLGPDRRWRKRSGIDESIDCPAFTASLDAMVGLVGQLRPRQYWSITEHVDGFVATVGGYFNPTVKGVSHVSAAIALCIAYLRARESQLGYRDVV